jgi:5S rRNA maturation endonuclease (ribonuclease M5)
MEDLDALKGNPAVLRVYAQYVSLKKAGDKYVGKCPLPEHRDSSPSFTVFSDMRASCFGCGANLNIFQLVMKLDNVDFKTAVAKVKAEVGDTSWEDSRKKVESAFKPVAEPKTYRTIPLETWQKLEDNLSASKAAKDFLEKERGISLETAQRLRVGFVQNLGALAGADGADIADKGWIAFPSIENEKVISVKYRSIARKKPGGFSRQPGMATALWNTETIDPFEPIFVVEGEMDAMVLEQAGFKAVSVPSAGAKLTPEMKDKLMQASLVILAGDTDAAGTASMDKLWKELSERCFKLTWPESCKDANDCFRDTCGRDVAKFAALVEDLTSKAKSQPTPDIYGIQEVMRNGEDTSLADRPDRLRMPWKSVEDGAVLLPGSVMGALSTSTGQGKTAFTLQLSLFGARKHNEIVVNWQCELSPSELSVMVAAQVLHKNRNFLTKDDLRQAADQLDGVSYYIGNNPTISGIMEVLDLIEVAVRRVGATVVVIDNLHFYTTGIDDEVRVQAAAMKRIKQMAVAYSLKIVVVYQPRKAQQNARGKKTHISDVRGSASAGDTADAVVAIHRDIAKGEDESGRGDIYEEKTLVEWLKTRSKGVGKSSSFLQFFGEFSEFVTLDMNHEPPPE